METLEFLKKYEELFERVKGGKIDFFLVLSYEKHQHEKHYEQDLFLIESTLLMKENIVELMKVVETKIYAKKVGVKIGKDMLIWIQENNKKIGNEMNVAIPNYLAIEIIKYRSKRGGEIPPLSCFFN